MYGIVGQAMSGGILFDFIFGFIKTENATAGTNPENAVCRFIQTINGLLVDGGLFWQNLATLQFSFVFLIAEKTLFTDYPKPVF